jgi:aspartyl/asparaginyl beta-hydroxylase (cupin superfamily)
MFLDATTLPVAKLMRAHLATIDAALDRVRPEEFIEWIQSDAYGGSWRHFGLHHRNPAWPLYRQFAANRTDPRMRAVDRLLTRVPGLISSSYMWIDPGTHIYPHVDDPAVHSARTFLGLRTNPGAQMRVGEELRTIERGEVYCFESSMLHETGNLGPTPRIVFGIEVEWERAQEPLLPELPRVAES